jgi:hypothetical protein
VINAIQVAAVGAVIQPRFSVTGAEAEEPDSMKSALCSYRPISIPAVVRMHDGEERRDTTYPPESAIVIRYLVNATKVEKRKLAEQELLLRETTSMRWKPVGLGSVLHAISQQKPNHSPPLRRDFSLFGPASSTLLPYCHQTVFLET